jgi:hypothetical protein
VPPLLSYFVAIYIKSYIFDQKIDISKDLKDIEHPVVKAIAKHINYFKTIDEN